MTTNTKHLAGRIGLFLAVLVIGPAALHYSLFGQDVAAPRSLMSQSKDEALAKSQSCIQCHAGTHDPHFKDSFSLGCCDCHGGNPRGATKDQAHVHPRFADAWKTAGNPVRSYTLLNHETPDFIRFVNPGDLRIAHLSCGNAGCHQKEVLENKMSMMTHGCMLWGAALYNNGGTPLKRARYGESYSMHGVPQRMQTYPPPTQYEVEQKGVLPFLDPLPRFEMSQPGNILRIFERGGRFKNEIGLPELDEESGKPRARLSERGLGTENRTDPVFIGLARTRLLDPTLNFLGTNDHAGDYRSSGCTSCHVVYANDRSPVHSGPYAKFGNRGTTFTDDPSMNKAEPGHPIQHKFTKAIPSSQCIVCHIHPGTTVMNSYLGYMWWDNETDGEQMYPKKQKNPTAEEFVRSTMSNPEEAAARGNWSDPEFLANVVDLNPTLKHTQFADFHGHGWVFRAVYKKDRKGQYLDHRGYALAGVDARHLMAAVDMPNHLKELHRVPADVPLGDLVDKPPQSVEMPNLPHVDRNGLPVHLLDVHLERGMHCVDCHFQQDVHGNTKLYGEVRAAIEIQCIDCHGTITQRPNLRTSGPAAPYASDTKPAGHDLKALRTPFGKKRFEWVGDTLFQNSMVEATLRWEIPQTKDVITPTHPRYNKRAHVAKTIRFQSTADNTMVYGDVPNNDESKVAHCHKNMSCIACHSSWNPSCFGCHLPQKANKKMPTLHNEGDVTRNLVAYNFQTLRDDVYMLARDGDVTGNRINPSRSSCAIHVGSYNQNRDSIYVQQQTISADGPSGIAFSTNVPHTVRGGAPIAVRKVVEGKFAGEYMGEAADEAAYLPGRAETKSCTDCHVSAKEDNNAVMAQLLMHGTGYVNFIGRYCWVAAKEHGLHSVVVTEQDEPQAVIGSRLHSMAFPDNFRKHHNRGYRLENAHEHPGLDIGDKMAHPHKEPCILSCQPRGEYLYAACGEDGVRVFDIAFIDNKSFSERITTAPVSPKGQKFHVPTRFAQHVIAPCTPAPDPTRKQNPDNKEPKIHMMFAFLYVADKYEGLVTIGIGTTIDGNPNNNFLKRDVTFNPDGILTGASKITIAGTYAYICCDAGVVVVNIDDPAQPKVESVIGHEHLHKPTSVQIQFRYAFITDEHGLKVFDVTNLARPVYVSHVDIGECHSVYVARTYAYVAAGCKGLVIVDIENPRQPRIDQVFTAGGAINDLHDVKLGITYVSEFAYLADGKNGLRVVQLTSPETAGNFGFSPRPTPYLVATYKIPHGGHAYSIGRGVDRDRAVDESGNQIAVFGRVGARPLSLPEQQQMYLRNGQVWRVTDDPRDAMYQRVR